MTELEIYKHALENLKGLAERYYSMAERYHYSLDAEHSVEKYAKWRTLYTDTTNKIKWLEKLIKVWEGR